jgi:hypothetical protein
VLGLTGCLGALGFLALTGLSPAVTAVKLSAAQLACVAASKPSPQSMLASIHAKYRLFIAVSLSLVVILIIGKPLTSASIFAKVFNKRPVHDTPAFTMLA